MPNSDSAPRGARTITTYIEFEKYVSGFARRKYGFLWAVGRPGLSKSQSIRRATEGTEVCHVEAGQLTPLMFYEKCYEHLNQPVILDDAEDLMDTPVGFKLLCALGQSDDVKTMSYHTSATYLQKRQIPGSFQTRSTLCGLANRWTKNPALQSRAVLVHFDPPPVEVHRYVGSWFWDQEIYDWFGTHLHLIADLDCRLYRKAVQDKAAGVDWKQAMIDSHCHDAVMAVIQELEVDPEFHTVAQRVEKFKQRTCESRPTYFRKKKLLSERGQLLPGGADDMPRIDLSKNPPPKVAEDDDLTEP